MAVGKELSVVGNTSFQGGGGNNSLDSRHHGFSSLGEPEVPSVSGLDPLETKNFILSHTSVGLLGSAGGGGLEFYAQETPIGSNRSLHPDWSRTRAGPLGPSGEGQAGCQGARGRGNPAQAGYVDRSVHFHGGRICLPKTPSFLSTPFSHAPLSRGASAFAFYPSWPQPFLHSS